MLEIDFISTHPQWKTLLKTSRKEFELTLTAAFNSLVLPKKEFSVAVSFIDDAEIRQLNAQYRQKDKPTNVLSFPMIDDFSNFKKLPEPIILGDIVIAYETVVREAQLEDKVIKDHVSHLLIHGLLHLFGYDHMNKKDAKEMEELEVQILAEIGIADPY